MKSDSYLNLCAEQARLSPLYYRHGSIVVKGGKVIGRGFNDYRRGYDGGGVLKSGVLSKSASPIPFAGCTVSDKRTDPLKFKLRANKSSYKPVSIDMGNCGGSHRATASLSMHSEMMAINSALENSSPLMSEPSVSRLRAARVLSSSNSVPARLRPMSGALKPVHLDATTSRQKLKPKKQQHQHNHLIQTNQNHRVEQGVMGSEQHLGKDWYKYKQYKSDEKSRTRGMASKATSKGNDLVNDHVHLDKDQALWDADFNKGALRQWKTSDKHPLVSKGQNRSTVFRHKDHAKRPKLTGADVYVMRLARPSTQPRAHKKLRERNQKNGDPTGFDETSSRSTSTGSLHDELCRKGKILDPPTTTPEKTDATEVAAESRPCYRCISYMHSVGIKRVFWTTSDGKWDSAKVRDLVDLMNGAMPRLGDTLKLPVYVTKHEVLLRRRLMTGG